MTFSMLDDLPESLFTAGVPAVPVPVLPPVPATGMSGAWSPPANRRTASDGELFAGYADDDCGPGSRTNRERGTCDPIPGLAEGFAAMDQTTAIFEAALANKEVRAHRDRHSPEVEAMTECMNDNHYRAQMMCEQGFIPRGAPPPGMTQAECEALWRHGSAGGSDVSGRSWQEKTGESEKSAVKAGLKGSFKLFGVGVEPSGEKSSEDASMHEATEGGNRGSTVNRPAFRGYDEDCLEEVSRLRPRSVRTP